MKSGKVSLYAMDGVTMVSQLSYKSKADRKRKIGVWKRLYAAGFRNCFIQISPTVSSIMVGKNGKNIKYHKNGSN